MVFCRFLSTYMYIALWQILVLVSTSQYQSARNGLTSKLVHMLDSTS